MEYSEKTQSVCPNCGAPMKNQEPCMYCGDHRILEDRSQLCKDFLLQMNKELDTIPAGPGWLILLVWWGLPVLVFSGYFIFRSTRISLPIWVVLAIISFVVSTILAAGIRDDYQHKLFRNKLSQILEKFLEQNNLSYQYIYGLAIELFPEKSTVVSLLAEQQDLNRFLKR